MSSSRLRTRVVLAAYGVAAIATLLYTVGAPWRTI
jgi:hypothetical protein